MSGPPPTVLVLPGYQDSGPDHWQTHLERQHPAYRRVRQRDWDHPERGAWVAALDTAVQRAGAPVVLVAHSLGAITVAHWAASARTGAVRGALLVAPADPEREGFPPEIVGFAPVPRERLPFPSVLVASADDPWMALPRATQLAQAWGSRLVNLGPAGHINTEAGFGPWPLAEQLIADLS